MEVMMNLVDEIDADQRAAHRRQCAVCNWLDSLPETDQLGFDAAFAKAALSHAGLMRTAKKHGATFTESSLKRHRISEHIR